jgi:hypothetical protein
MAASVIAVSVDAVAAFVIVVFRDFDGGFFGFGYPDYYPFYYPYYYPYPFYRGYFGC